MSTALLSVIIGLAVVALGRYWLLSAAKKRDDFGFTDLEKSILLRSAINSLIWTIGFIALMLLLWGH